MNPELNLVILFICDALLLIRKDSMKHDQLSLLHSRTRFLIPSNDVLVSHPSLDTPKRPWLNVVLCYIQLFKVRCYNFKRSRLMLYLSSLHSTVGHAPSEPFASVPDGRMVLSLDSAVTLYTNMMVMKD
ncbi:hypothetical protein GYMLUDRAFT_253393 [Collybiopsis luxurians FD-317 M1]|uniref:Uncharacterized protein n=1 Tax=Collybiopsis luxurians FD-317 M1 TaxID=944289 RepID=A0A0D0BKK4_9AGAR|nr:hypothetical protein GYMLUDRAFT_253393 [Collybiopsis luxurians FD-317 M1]